ncbi:MAG: hexokinase [Treponemataceae bacterium]|nr:MAG: hexokinase [Treponemataceae bacterium]
MAITTVLNAFLSKYDFVSDGIGINGIIEGLLFDMEQALLPADARLTGTLEAREDMIPTWSMPPKESPKNTSVIFIDAGGTNFRAGLVSFDAEGKAEISDLQKFPMPAAGKRLSKKEFFDAMACNLDHVKNKSKRIGFCFSYPMTITPEGDGIALKFAKEVDAPEVVGCKVGECLVEALVERGWEKPEKIVLLNDTVAALLAGAIKASDGKKYSSYVGLILGTGLNTAYIESGKIAKLSEHQNKTQIVVCESGRYNKIPMSIFDKENDKTTTSPGESLIEKQSAGRYLGTISTLALKAAAKDGLFSKPVAQAFLAADFAATLFDIDQFLYAPYKTNTMLGGIAAKGCDDDYGLIFGILDAFIERAARTTTALIAAAVIKSGQGQNPAMPVCVLCEGTTFLKTHNLAPRVQVYLEDVLSKQRNLHYEIVTMDNAITLGAAIAGLAS